METQICTVCGREFEWSPEWYRAKGLQCPPLRCPTCADVRLGKDDHHTVAERECLLEFACCDVSQAVGRLHFATVEEQDGHRIKPYRRATIKGKAYGASWSGRIDVFDQRTDPGGDLARVRIMRTRHQAGATLTGKHVEGPCYPWYSTRTYTWEHSPQWEYVVLDDAEGDTPACHLVLATAIQKWNRDDSVSGHPLWSAQVRGSSRTGKHSGQAVLAVVDEDHPLTARRVHDRGALHKGDLLTLATAPGWVAQALLMKKADRPVETEMTVWPCPPQGEEGDR